MSPVFFDGDITLVDINYYKENDINKGDIVLALHPYISGRHIIKMIVDIIDGKYYLEGINKDHSTDSRSFGLIDRKNILGKVMNRLGE